MRRAPKLIVKPKKLPVTLDDVKSYIGISGSEHDTRLQLLAESATSRLDGYSGRLGRTLINQTWTQDFDPCAKQRLAFPNVQSATAKWHSFVGEPVDAAVTLDDDVIGYFVRTVSTFAFRSGLLRVTFVSGYGPEPEDVPAPIREAILMDIAHRYQSSSEEGQIRSETVEGIGTTAYNSPEQASLVVDRQIADLLRPYRRGNLP